MTDETKTGPETERFSVRIHLVRHGETIANRDGIVLGQIDSPLTSLGISQAKSFHRVFVSGGGSSTCSSRENHTHHPTMFFYRKVSSDLGRCRHTARLALGVHENEDMDANGNRDGHESSSQNDDLTNEVENEIQLTLDTRLRERAKGVREGQSKHLTYDQAMEIYTYKWLKKNQKNDGSSSLSSTYSDTNNGQKEEKGEELEVNMVTPLLESEDEVFKRAMEWIQDMLCDAHADHHHHDNESEQCIIDESSGSGSDHIRQQQCDILAVTHSGFLRILIENLVGTQLPKNIKREKNTRDGGKLGRLIVPNTSKTVIEFQLLENGYDKVVTDEDIIVSSKNSKTGQELFWKTTLVDLMNISHLECDGS